MTTRESDRLRSGSNPFDNAFIRTPWDRSFVDVPGINSRASDLIAHKIAETRESGESAGLVLVGDPGYGKSHLLARLRHQPDPGKLLTFVEPPRSPDRVFRHILRESIVRLGTTQFGVLPLRALARILRLVSGQRIGVCAHAGSLGVAASDRV